MLLWGVTTPRPQLPRSPGLNGDTPSDGLAPLQMRLSSAINTRQKRYSGGPGQQDLGRNRLEDIPANDPANDSGIRNDNTTQVDNAVAEVQIPQPRLSTHDNQGRRRFKWTAEINEYLYRSYLSITLGKPPNTKYSRELHRKVTEKFPEIGRKSIQNILDQRRQIEVRNIISPARMEEIHREVKLELGLIEEQDMEEDIPEINLERQPGDTQNEHIREEFETQYMLYEGIQPNLRPKLPKLQTNKETKNIMKDLNIIVGQKVTAETSMEELHYLIYIAAITAVLMHKGKPIPHTDSLADRNASQHTDTQMPWKRRLERKINDLRKDIGRLTQYAKQDQPSQNLVKQKEIIIQKHQNPENQTIIEILDLMKQKLSALANRLRRYTKSFNRRKHNRLFKNQKLFYRTLEQNQQQENNYQGPQQSLPKAEEVREFWGNIWAAPSIHNNRAKWIKEEVKRLERTPYMRSSEVTEEEVTKAIKRTQNWKSPGQDGIHNFYIKYIPSTHYAIAALFTKIIAEPDSMPTFLASGVTYLLPKIQPYTQDPSKYRPITCLPTMYKLLTSVITNKIYDHLDKNNIITEEQKGCRKGSRGCREQIVIDSTITEYCKKQKGNMFVAYIDYQKAFDSVPHSWLLEILKIYKIDPSITSFLQQTMKKWTTHLKLNIPNKTSIDAGVIPIKKGIFQGDSLSALWFCLALNPLSNQLKHSLEGMHLTPTRINLSHLFYMDDLKLYAGTRKGLDRLLRITSTFSKDIHMSFGLEKCKINGMRKGQWTEQEGYKITNRGADEEIQTMAFNETYKYLGVDQTHVTSHANIKCKVKEKIQVRLKSILNTQLSAINKVQAINTYALSVATYTFGVVKWTQTELEDLNRTTRVMCSRYGFHHPRSSIERFHLPRSKGGRGIHDLEIQHMAQINNMRTYFQKKSEQSAIHQAIINKDKNLTPLNLADNQYVPTPPQTDHQKIEVWKTKPLHGKYPNTLFQDQIDTEASLAWLRSGNIFAETEGFVFAIQDRVIATRNYLKAIVRDVTITDDKCRMCHSFAESIEHIINGCPALAATEYTERHNNVAKIIYQHLIKKIDNTHEHQPYYKYEPSSVYSTDTHKIYWNRTIITDRTINHNRPDITFIDNETKTTIMIEITVPLRENIERKRREKIEKYQPLANEIRDMWDMEKVVIIPIIIGSTGEIPKTFHLAMEQLNIPKNTYLALQKSVLLSTCHIVRKFLSTQHPFSNNTEHQ